MVYRSLQGKRVILTGVSSGIGLEMARLLAQSGVQLVLNARRAERVQALEQELLAAQCQVATVIGDITIPEVRQQLLETAQTKFGGLDILINNAGLGGIGNFADNDEARLRRIFEVNFFAPLELTRAAIPLLKQGTQPLIANVASVLGHVGVPKKSEYCASKFALHGFSDSLRGELEPLGIQVLLISPSTTQSEFFD
jgi:short-subunit dehydrogenase